MAARLVLPLLLVLVVGSHTASSSVVQTCVNAVVRGDRRDLYAFCVTTLQAAPGSATADAHGLAVIATNLTLANYTAAVATIKDLQKRGGWTAKQLGALIKCRQGYIQALNMVHSAVHALATGQKQAYLDAMGEVREAALDCEEAFVGADPDDKSMPSKVNWDAELVTTVAMMIVMSL
ncbi:uncharacterized protein LOC124674227 [Lolium rigidum]|uniref:uncharacterized protein LOC124674227 n=1 Tax=Lolium rigidum TaxID=89674 RepID=UPI001F5D29F4|nr:uncharacterized protein LOC124674227 [Lolium rigidum]